MNKHLSFFTRSSVAALAIVGGTVWAQTPQEHQAHHPDQPLAQPAPQGDQAGGAGGMPGGMPGMMGGMMGGMGAAEGAGGPGMMGMMSPEMMQRMMRMREGQPSGAAMGMGMCPMMSGMSGMSGMSDPDAGQMPMRMGRQAMGRHGGIGPGVLYGMPAQDQAEMTPERVRVWLEQRLASHGNPRLKIGEIATSAEGNITAQIVTAEGSLVQKLAFNRYPGLVRQVSP